MKTEQQQLSALYSKLGDMKATAGTLKHAIVQTKLLLKGQVAEFDKLVGSGWGHSRGSIGLLEGEIKELNELIEDRTKPVVVWKIPPQWDEYEYIVAKVTKKRIAIKRIGHPYQDQFNRDGTAVRRHSNEVIDTKATLGDDYDESN